jgi:hypothetical protein
MQGERQGGPAETYRNPALRPGLMALLDDGFPGLADRIATARSRGFHWDAVTEPFVALGDDGLPVAHVGVLEHRVWLMGQERRVAGLHAVVTRSDQRRRGWSRRVQEQALAWVDARYDLAKLATDEPYVYAPQGFRTVDQHRFRLAEAGGEGGGRPFTEADRDAFLALCPHREPISDVFASLDPGWLVGIDLALQGRSLGDLVVLDGLGAVVDWQVRDGVLHVHDVFAERLPELEAMRRLAPPHREVLLCCGADKLAPEAVPEPWDGGMMVRGAWPVPEEVPFCVGRLAEH